MSPFDIKHRLGSPSGIGPSWQTDWSHNGNLSGRKTKLIAENGKIGLESRRAVCDNDRDGSVGTISTCSIQ
jgi:hypothetical protein